MEYRLNRYISSSGLCSRREADKFIENGNVTINGKRATLGMVVLPGDRVVVNGNLIDNQIEAVYIALNKPVGIVSTTDSKERDNIVDFVGHEQRIFPIGRLDKDSQGLILLTNDGDIVNKILRVENSHKKRYKVTVDRPITDEFIERMSQGVPILDRVTRKCRLEQITPHIFEIELTQGLNRQIRRMCDHLDYGVVKLERIQIMNIKLGKLGEGNSRNLTAEELRGVFDMIERSQERGGSKAVTTKSKKAVKATSSQRGKLSKGSPDREAERDKISKRGGVRVGEGKRERDSAKGDGRGKRGGSSSGGGSGSRGRAGDDGASGYSSRGGRARSGGSSGGGRSRSAKPNGGSHQRE